LNIGNINWTNSNETAKAISVTTSDSLKNVGEKV